MTGAGGGIFKDGGSLDGGGLDTRSLSRECSFSSCTASCLIFKLKGSSVADGVAGRGGGVALFVLILSSSGSGSGSLTCSGEFGGDGLRRSVGSS